MTSIASQLPPPVQSGLYGLPARSDAATAFPAAVSLSYLKMGTQVLGTQLLPCESVVSLAKTTPPTTIVKSDGIPFASMFPGSGAPAELSVLLEKYNQLAIQESCLLQSLRDCSDPAARRNLTRQLQVVLQKKIAELSFAVTAEEVKKPLELVDFGELGDVLRVEEQPLGSVVANKYLEPPLVVNVDDKLIALAREGRLQVRATLCLTLTDETIDRTQDNKQEILQGHLTSTVGFDGRAAFNKLKIMDVSSKHKHQAFAIQLQLEEVKKGSSGEEKITPVGNPLKSSPLHVQSRINKRRRSVGSNSLSASAAPRKRPRGEVDSNFIDITSLLVLPQKAAANKLGISESMLCKRFKECTKRKWPYRYLRKIDKMLSVLTANKKGESIAPEDLDKIERLKTERDECLQPVKIRITGGDGGQLSSSGNNHSTGSDSPTGADSDSYEDISPMGGKNVDEESDSTSELGFEEDDEIAQVVSTLNLLKQAVCTA